MMAAVPPHLVRYLGPYVHSEAVPSNGLRKALQRAQERSGGRPVVLVIPPSGDAQDALLVLQAGRLAELVASTRVAETAIVHRAEGEVLRIARIARRVVLGATEEPAPCDPPITASPSGEPAGDWEF